MVLFFLLMNVVRLLVTFISFPALKRMGYGLTIREALVLSYGGLRGTLGLALSLIVGIDTEFPERMRKLAVFYMAGIATLSLLINGTTTGSLVKKLGITKAPEIKGKVQQVILAQMALNANTTIGHLSKDRYYKIADFESVKKLINYSTLINRVYTRSTTFEHQETTKTLKETIHTKLSNPNFHNKEIITEARYRLLRMFKSLVLEKHEEGKISGDAMRVLREACNLHLDHYDTELGLWQMVKVNFRQEKSNSFLLRMTTLPHFLGKIARGFLGDRVYFSYEVNTTFIIVAEDLLSHQEAIPVAAMYIKTILNELRRQRDLAVADLNNLEETYSGIMRNVHERRAAYVLLQEQKHYLLEALKEGRIDTVEFDKLVAATHKQIIYLHRLFDYKLESEIPSISNLAINFNIFAKLDYSLQKLINEQLKTVTFSAGEKLFEKGDDIECVYLILKGAVEEEFSDTDKVNRSLGSLIGYPHLVADTGKALYNVRAKINVKASKLPINSLRDIMRTNEEFEELIYKNSMLYMMKLHRDKCGELAFLLVDDVTLNSFAHESTLKSWPLQREMRFKLEHGGYIFSGKLRTLGKTEVHDDSQPPELGAKGFSLANNGTHSKHNEDPESVTYDSYYYVPPFADRSYAPIGHCKVLAFNEAVQDVRDTRGQAIISKPMTEKANTAF